MWGAQEDSASLEAMHAALDAGVNWVDTAPLYGSGRAERLLGRCIADLPQNDRPLIATKFGHVVNEAGERVTRASATDVVNDCETSLANLGVECIDLYQLHWPAPQPIPETAEACGALLDQGKIRAVGVSNFSVDQLAAWKDTGVPLHTVQNAYSLFRRGDEESVLPWCAENDVAYLAYSPMHRGMLFGGWTADKTFPAGDHRAERPDFVQPRLGVFIDAVHAMERLAADNDLSMAELATGALLSREGCTSVIVGARNAEQGRQLGMLGMPLKASVLEGITEILMETDQRLTACSDQA